MKKIATKAELRQQMARQVSEYLHTGGNVTEVAQGVTGRDDPTRAPLSGSTLFGPKSEKRIYVPEVVAILEQRRRQRVVGQPEARPGRTAKPRRKLVYDDFGEPLRWVWEDHAP